MNSVLIIEDDVKLRDLLRAHLEKNGFKASWINDFKNIEQEFENKKPDLILLDINLPEYDGFYLCRLLRKKSTAPIIILSARNEVMEQVLGIELGADDYITKPFSPDILLAKIGASLRRASGDYSPARRECYDFKGIKLDGGNFTLNYQGKTAGLTKNEYKLIRLFLLNPDRVIKKEELLEELWDEHTFVEENTISVNVSRAKSKFQELGIYDALKTKRGLGYIFYSQETGEPDE